MGGNITTDFKPKAQPAAGTNESSHSIVPAQHVRRRCHSSYEDDILPFISENYSDLHPEKLHCELPDVPELSVMLAKTAFSLTNCKIHGKKSNCVSVNS